jgi:GPH family glycoside/pentoside/hexuronide:cation symporter
MLTIKQKAAYGLGDFASNMVFQTVANFMLFFYTDVYGLSASVAGFIIVAVRFSDMVTDPLMGTITDRTRTRWGRYRPYLLWMPLPFAILLVLTFTTPDLDGNAKIAYAAATYGLLMLVYTIVNIPYSALGGAMSYNPQERASLQSYRFAFAMVAAIAIVWLVPRLVEGLGNGSPQRGWTLAAIVLGILSLAAFALCFLGTQEATNVSTKEQKNGVVEELVTLFRNDQWLVVFGISACILIMFSMRISVAPHYVKYYLLEDDKFLANFLLFSNMAAFIAAIMTNYLSRKLEKKVIIILAAVGLTLFGFSLSLVPVEQALAATIIFVLTQYFQNIVVVMMFSMVADCVDYGELKTGRRIMAMTFSGHLIAVKLGFTLGAGCVAWLLSYYGYIANQTQSADTLSGLSLCFGVFPAIFSTFACFLALFYKLSKQKVIGIQKELAA